MKLFTDQSKWFIKESIWIKMINVHKINMYKRPSSLSIFAFRFIVVVISILICNSYLHFVLILLPFLCSFPSGLSFSPKMATPTSATFTMRRRCTCCAWARRSCWVRGRCSRGSAAPRRTNRTGLSASRWSCSGPEPSWTRASMREPTSMPPTTKRAPACTTRRLLAWRTVLR